MINSIGGTGFSPDYKAGRLSGGSSVNWLNSFGQSDNSFGITKEQKEYLKKKYGSSNLNLHSNAARELMGELKEMGAITEQDFKCYNCPSWPSKTGAFLATREPVDFMGDIRNSIRSLAKDMEAEGKDAFGNDRGFLLSQGNTYKKLADLMDYIFS